MAMDLVTLVLMFSEEGDILKQLALGGAFAVVILAVVFAFLLRERKLRYAAAAEKEHAGEYAGPERRGDRLAGDESTAAWELKLMQMHQPTADAVRELAGAIKTAAEASAEAHRRVEESLNRLTRAHEDLQGDIAELIRCNSNLTGQLTTFISMYGRDQGRGHAAGGHH
jgi:hypothetical protein